ncbi:MAG: endonuclease MutS2, partial [Bacteroidales bacterium]|nr:endonuclease MutS2 [Bacteroidales bacterium]
MHTSFVVENKLGFSTIRNLLKQKCLSTLGEYYVDKIVFSDNYHHVSKLINQVGEFSTIIAENPAFPSQDYINMIPELTRIKIPGTFIEIDSLSNLRLSLLTIVSCIDYIQKEPDAYPELQKLSAEVVLDKAILKGAEKIIDEKGNIKNNASPELKRIRTEIIHKQGAIDKKIGQTLKAAQKSGWINKDAAVTIRNGRMVLPVPATYKRNVKGFIHDSSASGQTVYIEPTDIFDINNKIRDLENEERREIIKILIHFTEQVRPYIDNMTYAYYFLGMIDFIQAKARLALMINANRPVLKDTPVIDWKNAIHPLLFLSHKEQKKNVVPLFVSLNDKQRILIISGPNAGGKSICLKTIGLLQYMLQCGLLIPLDEKSVVGIFQKIFIDIGDEQSIENDLSTYSSHLLNIKYFIQQANKRSLFLIDEFGTGTEPHLGGAIAEATIEKMNEIGSYSVITTHYANLKLLANNHPGIVNGAMLFDSKKMQPLYRLKIGRPGSSYAFEIAKKIGFPNDVLDNASIKTGQGQLDFDQQLQQLELDKEILDKKEIELRIADGLLKEVTDKYQGLLNSLKNDKKRFLEEAKNEAMKIVEDSNKLIERTIKEIKEAQAEKKETKKIRENVKVFAEEIQEKSKKDEKVKKTKRIKKIEQAEQVQQFHNAPKGEKIKKGDFVRLKGQNSPGEVIGIKGKNAVVIFNNITIKAAVEKLDKLSANTTIKPSIKRSSSYKNISDQLNIRMAHFKLSIDVRGKRANEALAEIQKYIDEAILLNIRE